MTGRGANYARLAGSVLVCATPTYRHISPWMIRTAAAFTAFVPLLVSASSVSYTLMRVALLVFGLGLSVLTWAVIQPDALLDRVHQARTRVFSRETRAAWLERGAGTAAGGLTPGQWVCRQDDYQEQRRRNGTGRRGAPEPRTLAPYKLVIALYRINGNEMALGFADGTSAVWNPRTPTFVEQHEVLTASSVPWSSGEAPTAGPMLEQLIDLLHRERRPIALDWAASQLVRNAGSDPEAVERAIEVAQLWGLIGVRVSGRRTRRRRLTEHASDGEQAVVSLTEAGIIWHDATSHQAHERERRRKAMTRGGDHSINLSGVFSGPVTVAGRDVRRSRQQMRVSAQDRTVLDAIAALLASKDVPWHQPDVAATRPILERAVERMQLGPAVRGALATVVHSVPGVAWAGVVGNLAYEPVKAFLGM